MLPSKGYKTTKLADEDRARLTTSIVNALCQGQVVKFGLRGLAERAVERELADFEHTPIRSSPTWWQRWKNRLFGEVKPGDAA